MKKLKFNFFSKTYYMDSTHSAKVKSVYYAYDSDDKIIISINITSNNDVYKYVLKDFSNFLADYKIHGYMNEIEKYDEIIREREIKLKEKEIKLKEKEDAKKSKKTKVKINF